MTLPVTERPTPAATAPSENQSDPKFNPPGSLRLCQSAKKCMGNLLASPATKNIAGVMIATGAGVTLGCPWVIGLLIAVGVGTSWIGGVGIVIGAVGIALWGLSTGWSLAHAPEEEGFCRHVLEAGVMGVIGLPYVIVAAIGDLFDSSCCRNDPDSENIRTQTTGANSLLSIEPGREGRLKLQALIGTDPTGSEALDPNGSKTNNDGEPQSATYSVVQEPNSSQTDIDAEPESPLVGRSRWPAEARRQTSTVTADINVSKRMQPPPLLSQMNAKRNSGTAPESFPSITTSTATAT